MDIVAHRGLWGVTATENSERSIELAIRHGLSRIEVDVRQDADGALYLLHDSYLGRVCRSAGKLRAMPTSSSRQIMLKDGSRLLRLESAFDIAAGKARLCLDVKEPLAIRPILALAQGREDAIEVWTSNIDVLALAVRSRVRGVLISMGWHPFGVGQFIWQASGAGASAVSFFPADLEPFIARLCHNAGMPVQCGTPNDGSTWRFLARHGVQAIVTDKPIQCTAALACESHHDA